MLLRTNKLSALLVLLLALSSATVYAEDKKPSVLGEENLTYTDPDGNDGMRITMEALGGAVGGTLLGVAGFAIAVGVSCGDGGGDFCGLAGVIPGIIGSVTGLTLGVYGVGSAYGGNGGLGWTLLGAVGGGIVGVSLASSLSHNSDANVALVISAMAIPIATTVVAYELSNDAEEVALREAKEKQARAPGVRLTSGGLTPLAESKGALLTLGGTF